MRAAAALLLLALLAAHAASQSDERLTTRSSSLHSSIVSCQPAAHSAALNALAITVVADMLVRKRVQWIGFGLDGSGCSTVG